MTNKISKELFETIFKGCVFSKINKEDFLIEYTQPCAIIENSWVNSEISINDFFFECKEWAYSESISYYIESGYTKYGCYAKVWFMGGHNKEFRSDSEQQAVFDACQWILDKKGN